MRAIIALPRPGSIDSYLDEAREGRAAVAAAEERLDQALEPRATVVLLKQPRTERCGGVAMVSARACVSVLDADSESQRKGSRQSSIESVTYAAKSSNCSVLWRRDAWAISVAEMKRRLKASFDAVINAFMHPYCVGS